jgi:hypothetical protein
MSSGYLTGARRKTNWDLRYFPAGSIRSFLRKATFIFVIRVLQAIRELLILLFISTCDRCPHECLTDTPFKRQMTTLTVFNSSWPCGGYSAGSESPRTVISDGPSGDGRRARPRRLRSSQLPFTTPDRESQFRKQPPRTPVSTSAAARNTPAPLQKVISKTRQQHLSPKPVVEAVCSHVPSFVDHHVYILSRGKSTSKSTSR